MVGIHEGGFIFGNSHHMGPTYLMDHNVVLVTMNYRLGALGQPLFILDFHVSIIFQVQRPEKNLLACIL